MTNIKQLFKDRTNVHKTDIFPGVIDTNSKLDNMKNNYKTAKKKKYIKKKQDGGIIEASEYEPIYVSQQQFNYPDINKQDYGQFNFTNQLYIPSIINTRVQKKSNTNPKIENISLEQLPKIENISLEQLLKEEGIQAKISSGYRANSKTKQGKNSNHSKLDENGQAGAYDIVPLDGDFENLRQKIYGNQRIVNWLKSKRWGILEETTSNIIRKTGASGKHWHFGPDSAAIKMSEQNGVSYAKSGIKINKKNIGKFTSYCGGKVTQQCIDKAKQSKNKTLVKRAVFAENARKWQQGGVLSRYIGLINNNINPQVAFDTAHLSMIEDGRPNKYYSFGKRATTLDGWVKNATDSLTVGRYKNLLNTNNLEEFKRGLKAKQYNSRPAFYKEMDRGRESDKKIINQYNQQHGIPLVSLLQYYNNPNLV